MAVCPTMLGGGSSVSRVGAIVHWWCNSSGPDQLVLGGDFAGERCRMRIMVRATGDQYARAEAGVAVLQPADLIGAIVAP